jgi:seryl-tRNA synthetase
MTKQEFEDRTGMTVTEEIFQEIHDDYMSKSFDKDTYCKMYVANGRILEHARRMVSKIYSLERNFNECLEKKNQAYQELNALREKYDRDMESYRKDVIGLRAEVEEITRKYEELMKATIRKKMDAGNFDFTLEEKKFLRRLVDWTED